MALQVIFLDQVASTNAYLKTWSEKHGTVDEAAIFAKHQTNGRGQRSNSWESNAGENVLGSFLVRDCILSQLVGLNLASALAVVDVLSRYTTQKMYLKWPNDIFINDQKIAGVLLENTVQVDRKVKVVAGIGVNINQMEFSTTHATSLRRLTHKRYKIEEVCLELADGFYKRIKQSQRQLLNDANELLYKRGQSVTFSLDEGTTSYTIDSILYSGKLRVKNGEDYKELDHSNAKWIK